MSPALMRKCQNVPVCIGWVVVEWDGGGYLGQRGRLRVTGLRVTGLLEEVCST